VIAYWKGFLKTPYVEKTLEIPGEEKVGNQPDWFGLLAILETVVTLEAGGQRWIYPLSLLKRNLENLRYRNGETKVNPSRLHNFSWLDLRNQKKGIRNDITKKIGGNPTENKPTFNGSKTLKYYPND